MLLCCRMCSWAQIATTAYAHTICWEQNSSATIWLQDINCWLWSLFGLQVSCRTIMWRRGSWTHMPRESVDGAAARWDQWQVSGKDASHMPISEHRCMRICAYLHCRQDLRAYMWRSDFWFQLAHNRRLFIFFILSHRGDVFDIQLFDFLSRMPCISCLPIFLSLFVACCVFVCFMFFVISSRHDILCGWSSSLPVSYAVCWCQDRDCFTESIVSYNLFTDQNSNL